MLKRSESFHRSLQIFLFLLAVAAILFALFSFLTVKTNINIITSAIDTLKSLAAGTFSETLAQMQKSITYIYAIVLTEMAILAGGVVVSLIAVNYLLNLYFIATRKSLIDELTGVYNKRALYKILDQEIKRAERFKHPLTIIMMDIDFFKVYNDKNGHLAGDLLLQRISKLMQSKIRDVDTLGRYGGEEFLAILPETSHDSATEVAERIRKGIESAHFKGEEKQPKGQVTMSLGLVTFHGEYKSKHHLIHSADELLYQAKESGRNRLIKAYFKKHNMDGNNRKGINSH